MATSASPDYASSSSPGSESEQAHRMAGGRKTTKETFVDLHEHSIALGDLARWDRAAPLLAGGTLLLGAGLGAWVAGSKFTSVGVLVCVAAGLALLVGGLLLRGERIRSARSLHASFERRLALYDDDPELQEIKGRWERLAEIADEQKLSARIGRLLTRAPWSVQG